MAHSLAYVRRVVLRVGAANEIVASDGHLVAVRQPVARFLVLVECGAGESDDDDHGAEVDDVAAVAACVAMRELDHGGEHALPGMAGNDFAAAIELAGDGERDQHGRGRAPSANRSRRCPARGEGRTVLPRKAESPSE